MSTVDPAAEHADVLDRWFAAYNAHDVDALCQIADPSVEVIPLERAASIPPGTTYHGRDGLRTLLLATFERFPQTRLYYTPVRASGNRVTVTLEFLLDDGNSRPTVRTAACDYRIANGHIRRMRAYEHDARKSDRTALLSPRECEVLSMLAGGQTIEEIAGELVLSPLTVRTHVRNAKGKLHARTTAHAVVIALNANALDV